MSRTVAVLLGTSVALFAVSLALPAFFFGVGDAPRHAVSGVRALASVAGVAPSGLSGLLRGELDALGALTWLVNPLLLLAWIETWRGRRGVALRGAVPAFVLSLTFLWVRRLPLVDPPLDGVVPNVGYLFWVFATVAAFAAAANLPRADEPAALRAPQP